MRQKSFRSFSRAAMMLLMMLLTAQTAWANITLTPHITYGFPLIASVAPIQATTRLSIGMDIETKTLTDSQVTFTKNLNIVNQIRISVTNNSSGAIFVTYSGVEGITQSGTDCSFSVSDGNSYDIYISVSTGYTVHFDANGGMGTMADQVYGE